MAFSETTGNLPVDKSHLKYGFLIFSMQFRISVPFIVHLSNPDSCSLLVFL